MANTKDFKVKNGIQPTVYHEGVGTVTSATDTYTLSATSYNSVNSGLLSEVLNITGLFFKSDGTKMYTIGTSENRVFQYSLSTAWDVSTASYDIINYSYTSQSSSARGLFFKSDGTKMYIPDNSTNTVYQYSLSTAWDVSTASYDSKSADLSTQIGSLHDFTLTSDGTTLFASDVDSEVYQYTLSTAHDISTASYASKTLDTSSEITTFQRFLFVSPDGVTLIAGDYTTLFSYTMSTAKDLSTASYDTVNFDASTQEAQIRAIAFKTDGTKMYLAGQDQVVYQYTSSQTTNTLDLSTGSVFEITPTSDIQINLSNPADSGTVSQATLLLDQAGGASGDIFFFAADAGNASNYDDATGWTTIIDLANQTSPDTNFYLVRQTSASDGSYDISFATNNSNAFPSGGSFMCTNGATYQGVSNGTGTVSFASGLTVGESVLFLVESGDISNTTYTPPAGYTVLFESSGTETTLTHTVVSYKIADTTSESTSGGTFSSGSAYRALVHVQNSGTNATDGDMASEVQKATAVVSTFTVSDGGVLLTGHTITYDSTVEWPSGTAPTSPAIGETDVLTFSTRDGGTSYQAALAIDGAK